MTNEPLWLLTVSYQYDEDREHSMMEHQSLHRTSKGGLLKLMDVVHCVTGMKPEQTIVEGSSRRDDGAEFGDLDAGGDFISYSVVPLTIDEER